MNIQAKVAFDEAKKLFYLNGTYDFLTTEEKSVVVEGERYTKSTNVTIKKEFLEEEFGRYGKWYLNIINGDNSEYKISSNVQYTSKNSSEKDTVKLVSNVIDSFGEKFKIKGHSHGKHSFIDNVCVSNHDRFLNKVERLGCCLFGYGFNNSFYVYYDINDIVNADNYLVYNAFKELNIRDVNVPIYPHYFEEEFGKKWYQLSPEELKSKILKTFGRG